MPRTAPGRFGIPAAASGGWQADGAFVVEVDEIGNINRFRITLAFADGLVSGEIEELTGLGSVALRGRVEDD